MSTNRVNNILLQADLLYRAFPVEKETENHKIILQVVPLIKRIMEYRGATRGAGALPSFLLAMKHDEIYQSLQDLREGVNRDQTAYREALRAVSDAEYLLDYIFI